MVLALIVAGTINILHYQKRGDIPAQTDWNEEETKERNINSSENDARKDTAENNGKDNTQEDINDTKQHIETRDETIPEAEIDDLLKQIFPERSEVYYQALAASGYSQTEIQNVRGWEENREENKINFYEKVLKYNCSYGTKEQAIEQLTQLIAEYPELTDEQELEYRKRLADYERYDGDWIYDTIKIALYYEEAGRPDELLGIITTEEIAQNLKGEWQVLKAGSGSISANIDQTKDWYYGNISAASVLGLLEKKDTTEIYLIAREDVPCGGELYGMDEYARASTAKEMRFKHYYFHYIIGRNEDGTIYLTQKDVEM